MPDNSPHPVDDFRASERQFTDNQLARLLEIASVVECECPNHLAKLVSNLVEFERYAADCESRNPADARMHAYLHQKTAAAREIMEEALVELVRFEKIEV